ncbi:YchF/TatD family DNA exonuclease [Pantoea sp. Aalb]|uniref:YchF/TatD family DNA exonuclease n=1 Tax=Pantoea sp. Aalb TaxID=2576762 RepID=UPI0013210587|nr:YchF/TatD family DNA exonuclease [Pantoea sp. Aalb]MXP67458.1 YchF/TatD family DNA exonuclease [Pantoea sp. Aalb]
MFIIDSHCHLNALDYKNQHHDLDDVIAKAATRDVKFILAISTNLDDYYILKSLIKDYKNIKLSCGIHPLNQTTLSYDWEYFRLVAADENVIALGETGLDYHSQLKNKIQQQASFCEHIRTGITLDKPIIVHMRNASTDTLAILREEHVEKCGAVLHCFTENKEIATKLLDLGLYISFSGILTFRNANTIRDAACYVPLERILLETDSPYLAPVPYRGQDNQPAFTREIAEYMAALKNIDLETLADITTKNFSNLFHISMSKLRN